MERNSKKKVLNNKGFSLVELIVVIAIMAVLAGVAAPQVIKYIDQSREAADASNIAMLENAVQMALTKDTVYNAIDDIFSDKTEVSFTVNGSAESTDDNMPPAFSNEMIDILGGEWPATKSNKNGFKITIKDDFTVKVTYETES